MKPIWIVGAVALVASLAWRRRHVEPTLLVGGVLAAIAMAVYGSGLVHFPDLEELLIDVGERLGAWTYLLVGIMAFLETGAFVGLIAPGETAMLLGGLVAGQGHVQVLTLIGIVWTAAVAGDLTSFFLGRRLGRAFLVKHGPRFQITEERLVTVEGFFERHGGKAILIGRFVGLVRAIAPFLAGSSGMSLRRFLPYDIIGSGLWTSTFVLLGYVFWQSFDQLLTYAKKGALALGTVIVLIAAIVWLVRWLREPGHVALVRDWVDRQAERPALRPLAHVLRPLIRLSRAPARFVRNRVTPGDLGLELTTLAAVLSVGSFAFVSETVRVVDRASPTATVAADGDALRIVDRLQQGTLVDVAEVVAALGSLSVIGPVAVLAMMLLLWRRDVIAAVALPIAVLLTHVGARVADEAVDRPRPSGSLVELAGPIFPSGHAANAVGWVAIALLVSRALPSLTHRFAMVVVGVVLAVAVGLACLYLRANLLSDVLAGWGLGASIFAAVGMLGLVIGYVRNNVRVEA